MAPGFIKALLLDECPFNIVLPWHHCPLPGDVKSLSPCGIALLLAACQNRFLPRKVSPKYAKHLCFGSGLTPKSLTFELTFQNLKKKKVYFLYLHLFNEFMFKFVPPPSFPCGGGDNRSLKLTIWTKPGFVLNVLSGKRREVSCWGRGRAIALKRITIFPRLFFG